MPGVRYLSYRARVSSQPPGPWTGAPGVIKIIPQDQPLGGLLLLPAGDHIPAVPHPTGTTRLSAQLSRLCYKPSSVQAAWLLAC